MHPIIFRGGQPIRGKKDVDSVTLSYKKSLTLQRHDWYQSDNVVIVNIFARNIEKSTLNVEFCDWQVRVKFSSSINPNYEKTFELANEIEKSHCTFDLSPTKLELRLRKLHRVQWKSLEREPELGTGKSIVHEYPTSAKTKHNWSQANRIAFEKEEELVNPDEFFKKLYANASEDTRRAMMKSFIESGGTVLSTNWDEVGSKKVEPAPPEGVKFEKK